MGKFIVFEGCHASGKSTIAKQVCDHLTIQGKKVILTKEIFDARIRGVIEGLTDGNKTVSRNFAILYLIAADRYLHVQQIRELLPKYDFVISDRYILSSLVYQQMQGFLLNEIIEANSFIHKPDLTLYIQSPLEMRLSRSLGRIKPDSIFRKNYEQEEVVYNFVVDKFEANQNLVRIDNTFSLEETLNLIKRAITTRLDLT